MPEGQNLPTTSEIFKKLDTTNKISKEEVKVPLKNDSEKIDTNLDGYISKEEMDNDLNQSIVAQVDNIFFQKTIKSCLNWQLLMFYTNEK